MYSQLSGTMVIYDPLDRNIPRDGDNQAIKRVDLIRTINQLGFIETRNLDIPMTNEMSLMLLRMFTQGRKACSEVLKQYIEEAEKKGNSFQKKFQDCEIVNDYLYKLKFFQENNLLLDIDEKVEELEHFKKKAVEILDSVKLLSEVDGEELVIRQQMKIISMLNEEQSHEDLVENMFNLIEYRNQLKAEQKIQDIDQQAKRNLSINLADRYLEDLVTGISRSYESLLKFSYFMRKRDTTNQYSYDLLNGQVRQLNLIELIMNNQWN